MNSLMPLQTDYNKRYLPRTYQIWGEALLWLIVKKTLDEDIVESIRNGEIADQNENCRIIFSAPTSKN